MLAYYSKLSSEVYDLDKFIGRSFGDVEFYQERLSSCTGSILEPGTGTGRMLIPLLEKGLKVEGIDASTEMLTICRRNCEKRGLLPILFEGKMESFVLDKEYEAIIIPAGSFLMLHRREDSIRALKNFHKHLGKRGKLIIDTFLPTDFTTGIVSTRSWECENGDTITLENKTVKVDYINQYTLSHGRYEKWRNGQLIQTELEEFPLRWYGVEELKMLLEQTGYSDVLISADYKYGKYPTGSNQVITFEANRR
ncbi:class I SAM-dependent methyltransferase [Mesobacillus harenae]|uniref:class I SAM-dependent methyltransferase n=1 Tax=Mesobacillus harenae TaxID=2213203 RepID=UPI00157FF508|nr:class I SAM-dependent methyltransferase [Mesobacillus harenae]